MKVYFALGVEFFVLRLTPKRCEGVTGVSLASMRRRVRGQAGSTATGDN